MKTQKKKYLCCCYYDTEKSAALSKSESEALGEACKPHDAALRATGQLCAQGSLSEPPTWRYVRPKNGVPVITKGRYLQSNQQIGAFLLIVADDMDDAMQVASKHAAANTGEQVGFAVEVRECTMFETINDEAVLESVGGESR